MKLKRKFKRAYSRKNAGLYEHALDLYLNEDKPDEALRILFKLANAHYMKAYGEIGIILYREMQDFDKAQEWFMKAEKKGALFGKGNYEYGMFHHLHKGDWQSGLKYLLKAAEHNYGELLIKERNEIEKGKRYLDLAEADGYYEE